MLPPLAAIRSAHVAKQRKRDRLTESVDGDWLIDECLVCPQCGSFGKEPIAESRQVQNLQIRVESPGAPYELVARHLRHEQVRQQQIAPGVGLQQAKRLQAVRRHACLVSPLSEDTIDKITDPVVVLDDENAVR